MPLHRIASFSNRILAGAVEQFAGRFDEVLIVQPRHPAGEDATPPFAGHGTKRPPQNSHFVKGHTGRHRLTLVTLARELAAPRMAEAGLAPISALGLEALAAQLTHRARSSNGLAYFAPVAGLPGFARALARTLSELRLAGVTADQLRARAQGPSGAERVPKTRTKTRSSKGPAKSAPAQGMAAEPLPDLAALLEAYEGALEEAGLIDLAGMFALATEAARKDGHRWADLPVVLFDPSLDSEAHRSFAAAVAARAPECMVAVNRAEADEIFAALGGGQSAAPVPEGEAAPGSPRLLDHVRLHLFGSQAVPFEPDGPNEAGVPQTDGQQHLEIFSAPGEGLETVEIARRILRLSREGVRFDEIGILLRDPNRYQPALEDALRRAGIPAYFSRGTRRPDPAGRAFLALLECASERFSAGRFAEYLSLGQTPSQPETRSKAPGKTPAERPAGENDSAPSWVGPEDETLAPLMAETSAALGTNAALEEDEGTVEAPWGWERLIIDAGVIEGVERWRTRLQGLAAEWELQLSSVGGDDGETGAGVSDAAGRASLERRLKQLRNLERFALPLIERLANLPRSAQWEEWLKALGELAEAGLRQPTGVQAVLAELVPMSEVGPVGLAEVTLVLGERLRFLRTNPPPRRWGCVFAGSVEEARTRSFRVVFLPGLAEGLFPQRPLEDPLLLDTFRRAVDEGLGLRASKAAEERRYLHRAVAAAEERFIASYPRMEVAEARPRVPSFYALELPRAVEGSLPDLKDFEDRARDASPARLNWPAPVATRDAIDDAEYDLALLASAGEGKGAAHYLVEVNASLARSLRMRYKRWEDARWSDSDGLLTTDDAARGALGAHGLTARAWSPSALEQFSRCPYRFALSGIFGLRPREVPEAVQQLDPRTRGSLFHKVQDELYRELRDAHLLPVNRERLAEALDWCDRVLTSVAGKYEQDLAPAIPRVWASEIGELRTDLRGWLQHVAQNDDEWEPIEFEQAFGDGKQEEAAARGLELEEGLRLRGRIDVVERHVATKALRVTDHKTGKKPDQIPKWVGGGKNLQPLLYGLAAEKIYGQPVEIGRLLYATQRGDYTAVEIKIDQRARLFLRHLAADIDASITEGFLPAAPEKDACKICDYRVICGPYEEERLHKKNRNDERLAPLIEIRGMA